jgi:hypothetical protein
MTPTFAFQLFEITPVGLFALVGWAIAGVAVGKLLYKDDRQLKELQREANDLSSELSPIGCSTRAGASCCEGVFGVRRSGYDWCAAVVPPGAPSRDIII